MISESQKLAYQKMSENDLFNLVCFACVKNNIEIIKYVLTSTEMPKNYDIHYEDNYALRLACTNEHEDLIEFLMSNPELKEHSSLHDKDDHSLMSSCMSNHLTSLKKILSLEKLPIGSPGHTQLENAFAVCTRHTDDTLLKYLIFDYDIEVTEVIAQNAFVLPRIKKMFETRELNKKLLRETSIKTTLEQKNKV